MTPTPTPTPEGLANASTSIANGFGSTVGLATPLLVLLYIVGALLAAQFVAPWLAHSSILTAVSRRLAESIAYAIKGVAASAVLLAAAAPVWAFMQADGQTQGVALVGIVGVVGGYIALVAIGWLADRAVARFIQAHPDYDEWGDLWPEEPDEEPVADGGERP